MTGTGICVGVCNAVGSVDPHDSVDYASGVLQLQVYDTCYTRDANGLKVQLFEAPLRRTSEGFEGRIRPGVKFSDGTPMTAAHVASSLLRCRRFHGCTITASGSLLRIGTSHARESIEERLASTYAAVVLPKDGELLGTGPYAMVSRQRDGLVLGANPHAAAPPSVPELRVRTFANEAQLVAAMTEGAVDFTSALSRDSLDALPNARKVFRPGSSTALLWMNVERLTQPEVRLALARAVDRWALTEASFSNTAAFVARGALPPSMGRFNDGTRFDVDAARVALGEAPLARPLRMRTIWGGRAYLPRPERTAELLVEQFARVGVEVVAEPTSSPEDYQRVMSEGDFDLALGGWNADEFHPGAFLGAIYGSSMLPRGTGHLTLGCNFARWNDTETDALLEQLEAGDDAALTALSERLRSGPPVLALHHGAVAIVMSRRIREFRLDDLGFPRFAEFRAQD